MTVQVTARRHAELVRTIRAHDYRYYVLDDPAVTDREYDALLAELRQLEERQPELRSSESPTQRVSGAPRGDLRTVQHVERMLSLDNTYSEAELKEFLRRVEGGLPTGMRAAYCVE